MEISKNQKGAGAWIYWAGLGAFALGLLLGCLTPEIFPPIAFLGEIYVNLLKLVAIPLLMAEVAVSVYRTAQSFAKRIGMTVLLFVILFVLSFLITALCVSLLKPGAGMALADGGWDGALAATSLSGFFLSIVPSNIFAAMSAGSILPCILFSYAAGAAAAALRAEKTMAVVGECGRILSKMLSYIMVLTPLGVFALMGNAAATYGTALLGVAARYILLAWALCILITALVLILPVWIFAGVSPLRYIRRMGRLWLVSLSTCSSAATLPHTLRVCNEEFGVPESVSGLVVPLGCTIHMCGGAVSFCLLGMFSMQMAGIPVTVPLLLYMLLVATLMNMAAPGIPGGGIVLGATYLTILGAPTGFIGIYSGIYRLLDMAYTSVNVTGDVSAAVLITEAERRAAQRSSR